MQFPKGFLWGTATSAHQTEGNNKNSDWWDWEVNRRKGRKWPLEPSGIACDSYNRYEEDFDLCKQMNNNAVRISVEWARIEPTPGNFDQNEIEHYKKVLQAARDRGLKTFVTLHHFTNPIWFSKRGGWTRLDSPKLFARYAKVCAKEFSELTDFFLTINEPEVIAGVGYLLGWHFPGKHNPILALLVQINLHRAHNAACKEMKTLAAKPISIVKDLAWFETSPKWISRLALFFSCDIFLHFVKKNLDFFALNYYFTYKPVSQGDRVSDLNWWIRPFGLEGLLIYLKKYSLPIYITENGLADAVDSRRKDFIHDHLVACWSAVQKGVDLRGYFHWSLIDNYEWHQGFWPRFGLVEIDRQNNLQRKPRPSFYYYAEICKNNKV